MRRRPGARLAERERLHFTARSCAGCGREFEPVRAWHAHCSDPCRARANRQRKVQETVALIAQLQHMQKGRTEWPD